MDSNLCGELYQLPPVRVKLIYVYIYTYIYIYIYIYENADTIFKEQFISPNHSSFPTDDFHLFAENRPSIDHNESMLNKF